jgi:hypothetical protein
VWTSRQVAVGGESGVRNAILFFVIFHYTLLMCQNVFLLQFGHREGVGGFFSDADGPLQSSSRKGSVRSSHGMTFFQPEEIAGTVQLGNYC